VGFKWSCDPQTYTHVATGRLSKAGEVKGDHSEKSGYPGSPGWKFGVGVKTPTPQKQYLLKKV
jgi:hypothetical protein